MVFTRMALLGALVILTVQGCSSSSSSKDDTETGVFLDSPVINVGYRTETQEGVTNSLGEYEYIEGETVTFFIGDLEFPPTTATGTVTPLDLAGTQDTSDTTVVNIIRLLQTLDEDGDPDNGITITELATAAATQVDFDLSESDFENSLAVSTLVENSGSTNVALISAAEAIANFEDTLVSEDVDFIPNATITGVWIDQGDDVFGALAFIDDGTYLFMGVDDETDDVEEFSGMEWGTYTRNAETGKLSVTNIFDNTGDIGLHPEVTDGTVTIFAHVSGDVLTLSEQYEEDGTVVNESFVLDRAASSGLFGLWTTDLTDNELLAFIFFDDGTYVHLEVDEEDPIDSPDEDSGMEWGTYKRDAATGELLSITNLFDNNGDTGLNPSFANDPGGLFLNVSGDVLTLETEDEFFTFERQ